MISLKHLLRQNIRQSRKQKKRRNCRSMSFPNFHSLSGSANRFSWSEGSSGWRIAAGDSIHASIRTLRDVRLSRVGDWRLASLWRKPPSTGMMRSLPFMVVRISEFLRAVFASPHVTIRWQKDVYVKAYQSCYHVSPNSSSSALLNPINIPMKTLRNLQQPKAAFFPRPTIRLAA